MRAKCPYLNHRNVVVGHSLHAWPHARREHLLLVAEAWLGGEETRGGLAEKDLLPRGGQLAVHGQVGRSAASPHPHLRQPLLELGLREEKRVGGLIKPTSAWKESSVMRSVRSQVEIEGKCQ